MGYLVFGEVPRPAILVGAAVLLFGVAMARNREGAEFCRFEGEAIARKFTAIIYFLLS